MWELSTVHTTRNRKTNQILRFNRIAGASFNENKGHCGKKLVDEIGKKRIDVTGENRSKY